MILFETQIRYNRINVSGVQETCTETYLVEALSFSQAEASITIEMQPYITGDFDIPAIKRISVADIIDRHNRDADKYFRAKLTYITINERTMKEKRQSFNYIVRANDIDSAHAAVVAYMKQSLQDYVIAKLEETRIVELISHTATK